MNSALHNPIEPFDTIYMVLIHETRSGKRSIACYIVKDNELWNITKEVSKLTGFKIDKQHGGVIKKDIGSDAGAILARNISNALFGVGSSESVRHEWLN